MATPTANASTPRASVHSVHHFVFTVPDIDEAARFYEAFGLDVRRLGRSLALYTFGHPHAWATVHEAGTTKRLQYVALGVHAADAPAFGRTLIERGLQCDPHPLADRDGLWLRDPDGVSLQLVVAPKVSPSSPAARGSRCEGRSAPARSSAPPVRPRRLSHILRFSPDVLRMVAFCQDVLGLRLSDRSQDIVAFMHSPHGSDHHLVAFARSNGPGLHHSSWDVDSFHDVGLGADRMQARGYTGGWGLGRHVIGSNYFYYVRDPWGSYAEYSHDIDFIPPGIEWHAENYAPEDALYVWGPPPPQDFIVNHEVDTSVDVRGEHA